MKKFEIIFSEKSDNDIQDYIDFIYYEYKSPLTALRNYEGLINEIKLLSKYAGSLKYCTDKSIVEEFGFFAKRINYKKMAVIFYIYDNTVRIEAVIKQKNIQGL